MPIKLATTMRQQRAATLQPEEVGRLEVFGIEMNGSAIRLVSSFMEATRFALTDGKTLWKCKQMECRLRIKFRERGNSSWTIGWMAARLETSEKTATKGG